MSSYVSTNMYHSTCCAIWVQIVPVMIRHDQATISRGGGVLLTRAAAPLHTSPGLSPLHPFLSPPSRVPLPPSCTASHLTLRTRLVISHRQLSVRPAHPREEQACVLGRHSFGATHRCLGSVKKDPRYCSTPDKQM